MPGPILPTGVAPVPEIEHVTQAGSAQAAGEVFGKVLSEAIQKVETYRAEAEAAVNGFLAGEREDLHNVALAAQRAELAFELFLQARNKVVQAYQEIMRMQV